MKALDELFRGLSLEEPSASVDERILGFVRSALARRRRALAQLGSVVFLGSAAAGAAALVFFWPGGLFSPHPESASGVAEAAPLEAIEELRGDLKEIQEMAELIPPDRQTDQAMIWDRIRACLAELEKLEVELRTTVSSPLEAPSPSFPKGKVPEGTAVSSPLGEGAMESSLLSDGPGKGVNL